MTLQDEIDGLPRYPTEAELEEDEVMALRDSFSAALARLALAREWVAWASHDQRCDVFLTGDCTCGRDALLKALEVPRG